MLLCVWEPSSLDVSVQFLLDNELEALRSLVSLRELSLRGAATISGTGLAHLKGLSHLQVRLCIQNLLPTPNPPFILSL